MIIILIGIAITIGIKIAHSNELSRIKSTESIKTANVSSDNAKPHTDAPDASNEKASTPTEVDTNKEQVSPTPSTNNEPTQSVTPAPDPLPTGDCYAEAAKYDWNQTVADAVIDAESGGNPLKVNDNPSTGDYSIGCFQINIFGANARSRPSEAALKDPATNVAFAYKLYSSNSHSFIGQWGVCRSKVSCY